MNCSPKMRLKGIAILISILLVFTFFGNGHSKSVVNGFHQTDTSLNIHPQEELPLYKNNFLSAKDHQRLEDLGISVRIGSVDILLSGEKALSSLSYYFWLLLALLIGVCVFMMVHFIRLIRRFMKGEIMERRTYVTLMYLGGLMILTALLDFGFQYIQWKELINIFTEYQIPRKFHLDTSWMIAGLLVLAFGCALQIGVELKEENDLTI